MIDLDEDAVLASVDLVGRTGARGLEVGYLRDDVPAARDWWAHAQYRGARIAVEHHTGLVEALEALAHRLLTGAQCQGCGRLVALSDDGAVAFTDGHLVDGRPLTAEQAAEVGQCRWRRVGPKWHMGCQDRDGRRP